MSTTIVFDIKGLEGFSANHMYYHMVRRSGKSTYKSKVAGYVQYQGIIVEILKDFTSNISDSDKKVIHQYLKEVEYDGSHFHLETYWTYDMMRTKAGAIKKKDSSNLLKPIEDSIILAFDDEDVVNNLQTHGSQYDDRHHEFCTTKKFVSKSVGQVVALTTSTEPYLDIKNLIGVSSDVLVIEYEVEYYKIEKSWHYKLYRVIDKERELVLDTNS